MLLVECMGMSLRSLGKWKILKTVLILSGSKRNSYFVNKDGLQEITTAAEVMGFQFFYPKDSKDLPYAQECCFEQNE